MISTSFLARRDPLQAAGAAAAPCTTLQELLLSCKSVHPMNAKRLITYNATHKS
jgi:hypothetical protein